MKVTEVTVTIHEKRNNPFKCGHYDCSVTYRAELEKPDSYGQRTRRLREIARAHVEEECAKWEDTLREQHRIEKLEGDISFYMSRVVTSAEPEAYRERVEDLIFQLPTRMRTKYMEQLEETIQEREAELEEREKKEAAKEVLPEEDIPFWFRKEEP